MHHSLTMTTTNETNNETNNEQPDFFLFRGIAKPVKTWGKDRGATVFGDFVGYKRKEWVEYCNGDCDWAYMVELPGGERFAISEQNWQAARQATKCDLLRARIKK